MRIVGVDVFGYELSYGHGSYVMSGGRAVERLPSTVVRVRTDEGVEGWGETCPLGTTYLAASGEGARTALRELAPGVLGVDPTNLALVNEAMDRACRIANYRRSLCAHSEQESPRVQPAARNPRSETRPARKTTPAHDGSAGHNCRRKN